MNKYETHWIYASILLIFLFKIISIFLHAGEVEGDHNMVLVQAESFSQFRLDIPEKLHDVAVFHDLYFSPFAPFPSMLMAPMVWLFGKHVEMLHCVAIAASLLNLYLLHQIFNKISVERLTQCWLLLAFLAGTSYWFVFKRADQVWFFSQPIACTFLFLSLYEAMHRGRGYLIGIYLGIAFLSRQMSIYFLPLLVIWIFTREGVPLRERVWRILSCGLAVAACILFYLWINWLRFDDPFNTGYAYIELSDSLLQGRIEKYGLFHPIYVPFNLIYLFIQGFHVEFAAPLYLYPECLDPFGTSLTFASPFLFVAFWAKGKRDLLFFVWLTVFLILIHSAFYYNNGWVQVNAQRYSLDFLPALMILVALGAPFWNQRILKVLILYSVFLNFLSAILCSRFFKPL